jgi:hypothetical protein
MGNKLHCTLVQKKTPLPHSHLNYHLITISFYTKILYNPAAKTYERTMEVKINATGARRNRREWKITTSFDLKYKIF